MSATARAPLGPDRELLARDTSLSAVLGEELGAACQVMEIEDGKIRATRHCFDLMTILQQIGAMERAGATA